MKKILLWVFIILFLSHILTDVYASNWLGPGYALAQSKYMLGEARSKYASGLPGAGGAIQLNGETLKGEAQNEMQMLKDGIHNMEEGNIPLNFVIG